ncbi:MAG: 2,3-bisphosphoglycerate-independent phosphoglycerate mutase [Gordonibacter sp.]|uniref:2,3-bisphosphoglycerate-independent phosphoglycerate mutase n=1 Tax=Gordonibacter sp. TaxID=1968902 RepID=UPI002FC9BCC8
MSVVEGTFSEHADLVLPVCLIIMDGFGLSDPGPGNAISQARTPCLDEVFATCPTTQLAASGEAVGLPEGQMGNSEVGHLNIGAGRVVYQELTRINRACDDGSLAANPTLNAAFATAAKPGAALHLMGLLSDGGVHSTNGHLYALMGAAKAANVGHIVVHCFMDGRDVAPKSGAGYLRELEDVIAELSCDGCTVEIGSIEGRYFAMDRDNRWERVERAWRALALAEPGTEATPQQVMAASYEAGITDEFVEPVAFSPRGMRDGDAAVFFNFRPDRAREITRALVDPSFVGFERSSFPQVQLVCLTEYDPEIPAAVAFAKEFPADVLADVLADAGLSQYRIAETEKYAHVTFFLNGGVEEPKAGERRVLVPSPKVATYDLQPEMSEPEVASTLASAIDAGEADVYIVNFANCDMVGHTGFVPAAVAAVEAVDTGVGQVLAALKRRGGVALITADHGNADKMLEADGSPFTAHTTALVPLALADYTGKGFSLDGRQGALCDLAPTLLAMIGLAAPGEMDGRSLLAG